MNHDNYKVNNLFNLTQTVDPCCNSQFKAILLFSTLFMWLVRRIIPPSKTIQSTKTITKHGYAPVPVS